MAVEIRLKMIYASAKRFYFPMRKPFVKKIGHWLEDSLARGLLSLSLPICWILPPKSLIFIAKILGSIAFYTIKKYRERVIGNLFIAFGKEKDIHEIRRLAREVFFHFTLTPLETIYAYCHPFEKFVLKIEIRGREYLESALAQKKGVVALGIHMGPFTLVGARLALEGYPFNLIINEGNFPKVNRKLWDYQRRLGQKIFPPKPATASVKKSLNCLHRNEILYLIADQQQRRGGLPTLFFGQTAYTPPGPAVFSLKTGAPILPMFILREKGTPQTLLIGSPIEIERTSDERKDIEVLTAKFTQVIEEMVKKYPSQWSWLNRRWKLPPKASLTG